MGIGPSIMSMGDQVVILKGGPLPFILRQNEQVEPQVYEDKSERSVWNLVGEAYVHGLSAGEGIRHLQDPDDEMQWTRFLLR